VPTLPGFETKVGGAIEKGVVVVVVVVNAAVITLFVSDRGFVVVVVTTHSLRFAILCIAMC
jgi:hypothetical protein